MRYMRRTTRFRDPSRHTSSQRLTNHWMSRCLRSLMILATRKSGRPRHVILRTQTCSGWTDSSKTSKEQCPAKNLPRVRAHCAYRLPQRMKPLASYARNHGGAPPSIHSNVTVVTTVRPRTGQPLNTTKPQTKPAAPKRRRDHGGWSSRDGTVAC